MFINIDNDENAGMIKLSEAHGNQTLKRKTGGNHV